MAPPKHALKTWGALLGAEPGTAMTLDEAQLYAALATVDRLLEVRDALQDIQMRLTRLERYAAVVLPGYDPRARQAALRMLEAAESVSRPPDEAVS